MHPERQPRREQRQQTGGIEFLIFDPEDIRQSTTSTPRVRINPEQSIADLIHYP